jgi:hypothetical protein
MGPIKWGKIQEQGAEKNKKLENIGENNWYSLWGSSPWILIRPELA